MTDKPHLTTNDGSLSHEFRKRPQSFVMADDEHIFLRIFIPDLNIQKCLQFKRYQPIAEVKLQCIASLPQELKQNFNYGLFYPPSANKHGFFLHENKVLSDYLFSDPVVYLELKYKQRIYRTLKMDEKQFKSLHTRTNLRRFLDYVRNNQVEKIIKICSKGLDPNFHCVETGHTPLTLATLLAKPSNVLLSLVNGGAYVDFRTLDGSTALHKAVEFNNLEAVVTLLELGAHSNDKDAKGLTSLYICVTGKTNADVCEKLLQERAQLGTKDMHGWEETHQACKNGLAQHLEYLLSFGADMNAKNASGNTPLHVCALNGREACARLLLYRGASTNALNYANQTAYQVAVIAGNLELATLIETHRPENTVPFQNNFAFKDSMRRSYLSKEMAFFPSNYILDSSSALNWPPSLATPNFHSAYHEESIFSDKTDDFCSYTAEKSACDSSDVISNSSGIGTANSDITVSSSSTNKLIGDHFNFNMSGKKSTFFDQSNYDKRMSCCLPNKSDHCLAVNTSIATTRHSVSDNSHHRLSTNRSYYATAPRQRKSWNNEPRTVVLQKTKRGYGFILRGAKASSSLMDMKMGKYPALQYLDDIDTGGAAELSGLRKGDYLLAINKVDVSQSSHEQVVELIRKSGNVVSMTVVSQISQYADAVDDGANYKYCASVKSAVGDLAPHYATLPNKFKSKCSTFGRILAPLPPRRDPKTTLSIGKAKSKNFLSEFGHWEGSASDKNVFKNTPIDGQLKTASIRSRPISSRITTAELQELFQRQEESPSCIQPVGMPDNVETVNNNSVRVYASVADMKRKKSNASSSKHGYTGISVGDLHRNFHSVPDLVCMATVNVNDKVNGGDGLNQYNHHNYGSINRDHVVKLEIGDKVMNEKDGSHGFTATTELNSSFNPKNAAIVYSSSTSYDSYTLSTRSPAPPLFSVKSSECTSEEHRVETGMGKSTFPSFPPIPDPDYSQSDEESDACLTPPAAKMNTSSMTNMNAKGIPSNNPVAAGRGFNVEEILIARSKLKPFPTSTGASKNMEDGDNSSSGVSSDQEINPAPLIKKSSPLLNNTSDNISITVVVNSSKGENIVVPPPPEFTGSSSVIMQVLAPPPQFSDANI